MENRYYAYYAFGSVKRLLVYRKVLTKRRGELQFTTTETLNRASSTAKWRISLSSGQQILLYFEKVEFSSKECLKSYVVLQYEKIPSKKSSNLIRKYCFNNPLPALLKIESNEMTVTFHNDGESASIKPTLHVKYEGELGLFSKVFT